MSEVQRSTITIACTYLGGHRLLQAQNVSVQLRVGVKEVVVEVTSGSSGRVSWPSRVVYDVFVVCPAALPENLPKLRGDEAEGRSAVAFLVLDAREDGGGVSDIRFGFWHESLARDFVQRALWTLG